MKKLIVTLLVVCMVASLGMAAFAVDPTAAAGATAATEPTNPTAPTTPTTPTTPTAPTGATEPTGAAEPTFVFPFKDVEEDHWGYPAVYWAAENGVTNGISATEFGPELGCTRAQVVTLIWRQEGCPKAKCGKGSCCAAAGGAGKCAEPCKAGCKNGCAGPRK